MNFKHLHYFWVTARAGGVLRAGEQLHTTPQTVSSQIKLLEERLGRKLFRKAGRQLELTEEGRTALRFADEIFQLGGEMEAALRGRANDQPQLEFRVGVADLVAKAVVYRLLQPALDMPEPVRMVCSEGKFEDLLGQLALHKLDLVLADEPLPKRLSVKAFNHALGSTTLTAFAAPALRARLRGPFPQCLHGAPMLVQGAASSVRQQFDAWCTRMEISPRVLAEFDDGALMKAFGREGGGVFLAPTVLEDEIAGQYGVQVLGQLPDLQQTFYAISVERRISHPCVVAINDAAQGRLFS
jgi:LysR family transcriptional regulator, transcriptional activator of nhaA